MFLVPRILVAVTMFDVLKIHDKILSRRNFFHEVYPPKIYLKRFSFANVLLTML